MSDLLTSIKMELGSTMAFRMYHGWSGTLERSSFINFPFNAGPYASAPATAG